MPAPVGPLFGFALGAAFAWAASDDLARSPTLSSRSLALVTLFGLLIFAPISGYFLAFGPDWSYAYFVDSQRLPGIADLGLILLDATSVSLGFFVAAPAASRKSLMLVVRIAALPALGVLSFVMLTFRRLSVSASYAQFHGDFGIRPLSGSPLGYALLWMASVLLVACLWMVRSLRRLDDSRRRD